MPFSSLVLFLGISIVLIAVIRKDYVKGLCLATCLLVSLPKALRIPLPGALPNLTIQRMVLIVVFLAWLGSGERKRSSRPLPFVKPLLLYLGVSLAALLCGIAFMQGLKDFLSFSVEVFLFYWIVACSIRSSEDVVRILKWMTIGLAAVAAIGVLQRYTGINLTNRLVPLHALTTARSAVLSSYPHRIHFGTAMSMAWPIALAIRATLPKGTPAHRVLGYSVPVFFAACYFSQSRGPWLGSVAAAMVMLLVGTPRTRKPLWFIMALVGIVLLLRPGVWGTLSGMASATADTSTMKGGSFQYRWELWKIAYAQVTRSPVRFLIGYGPAAATVMEINSVFDWKTAYQEYVVSSWDNHYAHELLSTGFLGLGAFAWLYGSILKHMYVARLAAEEPNRTLLAGILASAVILLFMMSNVLIFAAQLNYIFWVLAAAATALSSSPPAREEEPEHQPDPA